jgi:hypothetical protein
LPSHDLDHLQKWKGLRDLGGALKKAVLVEKSFVSATRYARQFFENKNPFDNVAYLMELAEKQGVTTIFYFLPKGSNKLFDRSDFEYYSKIAGRMKSEIIARGHEIGLHGSYNSYNDEKLLGDEKKLLEEWLGFEVQKVRQHYLRLATNITWPIQNKLGFKEDASLGYSDSPGFRSGTSRTFNAYDLSEKKQLEIKVNPLIMMDTSYLNEITKDIEDHENEISKIRKEIKHYGVNWHFLIHNSSFFWQRELLYSELWESFYREI